MDLEKMDIEDLKDYAKSLDIKFGKIGKEKLIEKIKEVNSENETKSTEVEDNISVSSTEKKESVVNNKLSLLDTITMAIDELEEADGGDLIDNNITLSLTETIPVKSVTFGGLTYKSKSTNALFRWNQIGAVEYMTVAELNEMNNYKRDYLNRPLLVLLDERAIKKFRLTQVYENVAKINNLKSVFNSDMATIEATIDMALKVNMRDILISKVRGMIENKSLVNVSVIKLLEKKLQHDLIDTIE